MWLQGTVTSTLDELPLVNANVYVSDASGNITTETLGTATNVDGVWQMEVPPHAAWITASHIGYGRKTLPVLPTGMDFDLVRDGVQLPPVSVSPGDASEQAPTPAPAWAPMLAVAAAGIVLILLLKNL